MHGSTVLRRTSLLGALALAAACSELDQATGPELPAAPPDIDPEAASQAAIDRGEELSRLAREVPGFGGLYIDENGTPWVWLTGAARHSAAEAKVGEFLRDRGHEAAVQRGVRVRQADFEWRQLEQWFAKATDDVFDVPGTVYADLNEAANRLTIGVEDAVAGEKARAALLRAGVPESAVMVVETEPIYFAATLRDRVSPRVGGLQIHFGNFLCTLGFNARDGSQDSFITNSHCTNNQGGVENTVYYQPLSSVDGTSIGTEVEDPTYRRRIAGCPRGRRCRYSDSARVRYNSGIAFTLGGIARTALGSITINGNYTITSEGTAVVGQTVNKEGRTTGRTQGVVTNTCVTTSVSGTNIAQICQTFVSAGVGGGDSGSPVFRITGSSNVQLVGILWGGNGSGTQFVFSPLANIEQELGPLTTF